MQVWRPSFALGKLLKWINDSYIHRCAGASSPWSPPSALPASPRIAPLCRPLSHYGEVRLLTRVHHRLRLLASPMRTDLQAQTVTREISRFPYKELLHMPGSLTTRDWSGPRAIASVHIAFRTQYGVGIQGKTTFAAQWLAYALPRQRFA